MVGRSHNVMTMRSLRRSREPVLALRLVYISRPLLLCSLDERLTFLSGAHQALVVDTRRVRKDVMGP